MNAGQEAARVMLRLAELKHPTAMERYEPHDEDDRITIFVEG
jgi:hypothetical protein